MAIGIDYTNYRLGATGRIGVRHLAFSKTAAAKSNAPQFSDSARCVNSAPMNSDDRRGSVYEVYVDFSTSMAQFANTSRSVGGARFLRPNTSRGQGPKN